MRPRITEVQGERRIETVGSLRFDFPKEFTFLEITIGVAHALLFHGRTAPDRHDAPLDRVYAGYNRWVAATSSEENWKGEYFTGP